MISNPESFNKSDLNYCTNHKPCKNDALCTNTFDETGTGTYTCSCPAGFVGRNCEKKIQGNCSHNSPCLNGGECYVEYETKDLHCSCPLGFTGQHCEIVKGNNHHPKSNSRLVYQHQNLQVESNSTNEDLASINCVNNPCKNGGVCISLGSSGFECDCRAPYRGSFCESLSQKFLGTPTNDQTFNSIDQQVSSRKNSKSQSARDQQTQAESNHFDKSLFDNQILPLAVHHIPQSHNFAIGQVFGYAFAFLCCVLLAVMYVRGKREEQQNRIYSSYVDVATLQNQQNTYRSSNDVSAQSTIKSRTSNRTDYSTYDHKYYNHNATTVDRMPDRTLDRQVYDRPPPAYDYHTLNSNRQPAQNQHSNIVPSPTYVCVVALPKNQIYMCQPPPR